MTAKEVLGVLAKEYPAPDMAFIPEFRASTGFSGNAADAIAIHCWPSMGLELIGYEIKISRSDWLRERKDPLKSIPVKQFCDRWYLLVSELKIVTYAEELPPDWGLKYIENGQIRTMIEAPKLNPIPIDRPFLASLMRRATKAEMKNPRA